MVIVYATGSYVSRYFPALDACLTFPVVYQYSTDSNYRMPNESHLNNGVITQRRVSVIQEVPRCQRTTSNEGESRVTDEALEKSIDEGKATRIATNDACSTSVERIRLKRRRSERSRSERPGRKSQDQDNDDDFDWRPSESKRHKCAQCGMRFKKPSALVIHLRTHSGEKPFKCQLCDKRFSISGNLRRHMFTHTGEKPYKCRACGRAFNNPSHLARHSKKIHI